jgi:quinol monooxygenase YgiN
MSAMGVVVIIDYRASAGHEETTLRELTDLVSIVVREEPDCGGITILQNADDPARIRLVEHWTSREAYLGPHMKTPHLEAFIQRAAGLVAGPPDITFWNETARV